MAASPLTQVRLQLEVRRTLPRVLTLEDLRRLLSHIRAHLCPDDFVSCRNTVLLEVLISTAARIGEVVQLRPDDYDPVSGQLLIRGKGRRERIVFLHDQPTRDHLARYLDHRAALLPHHEQLFLTPKARPLTPQSAARIVTQTAAAAGLSFRVTPHQLRHTTATLLLNNGADLRTVQELLGHTSIVTTQRYTQVTKGMLLRCLEGFHPMNGDI